MAIADPPAASSAPPPPPRRFAVGVGDRIFRALCQLAGLTVLAIAALLVVVLVIQAWPALSRAGELNVFTSSDWNPSKGSYGAMTFVYGTLITSAIAMLVAVPLGVGSAAFLSEIAPRAVRKVCSFLLELLAAIPSVVYGFWAKAFLAPAVLWVLQALHVPVNEGLGGEGLLSAGLVLSIMILPYITAVSYDVCQAVPRSQREGALALGATRWQTIWQVVLPYARAGIVAGCFLALGRALGETMAVTMVVGNAEALNFSPASAGDTIPSIIAKGLPEAGAGDDKRSVLIALGVLLLLITLVTNVVARLMIRWASRPRVKSGPPVELPDDLPPPSPPSPEKTDAARRRAWLTDRLMTGVLAGCQLVTVVPLFLILGYIAYRGAGYVSLSFFTQLPPPLDEPGGLGQAVVGSLMLVALAAVCAVPVGILAAVYLAEYRTSRLAGPVRFVAELMGGVPSIVIGVYGYAMLVYPFWAPGQRFGFSAWAGSFALGVLMLPVVIRAAEEAMKLVPRGLREASYALGATQWQTVVRVIVPAALPAILTGVLLAVGRVAGETAPLILTASQSKFWPKSPSEPTASLPLFVYEYSKNTFDPDQVRLGWAGAFVLLVAVLLLNITTRLVAGKRVVDASRAD